MDLFKVGDRVIGVDLWDGNERLVGATGRIVSCDGDRMYSVAWDEDVNGHNLEGRCADGHGWHTYENALDFYEEAIIPDASITYEEVMR